MADPGEAGFGRRRPADGVGLGDDVGTRQNIRLGSFGQAAKNKSDKLKRFEFALETASDPAHVVGRIHRTRGSRTLDEERPVKPGTPPEELSEEDVLTFLLDALQPWLER